MPDPTPNQNPEQIAAQTPPIAPQSTLQPLPNDSIDNTLSSASQWLQGIRARVAPVVSKVAPYVAPFVAAADAASGGALTMGQKALQTPQAKAVGEEAASTITNPQKRAEAIRQIPQVATEFAEDEMLMPPPEILKGIRAKMVPSETPEVSAEQPDHVYRARPVGQEGIGTESHAQATASLPEAQGYAKNLEDMSGKPHEVVRVDLKKTPAKYDRLQGPNGNDWIKFHEPIEEKHIETVGSEEAPKVEEKPAESDIKKTVEDAGAVFRHSKNGLVEMTLPRSLVENSNIPDNMKDFVSFNLRDNEVTPEAVKAGIQRKLDEFGIKSKETVTPETAQKIVDLHNENGGSTYNLTNGNLAGTENYSVPTHLDRGQTLDHEPTVSDIQKFADKNKDLLNSPNKSIGTWFDKAEGNHTLDVISTTPDRSKALSLGKQNNQKSIFDLKNNVEIPTGGTGKITQTAGDTISTRVPTAVKSTENALSHNLKVDADLIHDTPGLAEKHAALVQDYPGIKIDKKTAKDPKAVLDSFTNQVKDNLKWLYKQSTPEEQEANKGWYDGAHALTKDLADKYGIDHRAAAGMTASLSPQKDWDMNVSLAKRVADVHFNHANEVATPEMIAKGNEIVKKTKGNETLASLIPKLEGKTYNQLTEPIEKAAWLRLYDEAHNPRDFQKIAPDGTPGELRTTKKGEPAKVAWGSLNEITKASSILQDPSKENISTLLGQQHKVRSFYNNIIEPNSPRGDTTIDTHAVAAGLLRPLSGNSEPVTHNFSGPGSNQTGLSGTYPLYQKAYADAAKELDIEHPRMLQSVVWEKIRKLFPSTFKNEENNAAIDKIWEKHSMEKSQQTKQDNKSLTTPKDEVLEYLKKQGVPLTKENYLALAYLGDQPPVGAELAATLPKELKD